LAEIEKFVFQGIVIDICVAGDCIQIYHVWEEYLRKIPVERRKFPEPNGKGNLVSRLVFFANTSPKHEISV
jgi:hypothetical protein